MVTGSISLTSLHQAAGVEICGVDISKELDDDSFQQVLHAWHKHGVIVLRGQNLSKGDLVRFSARFGTPVAAAPQERELSSPDDSLEVMIVSNVVEHGKAIGHLGSKEAYWHTDMCYTADPPIASMLYAIEVPPAGGDTSFMNMYQVYDRLPDDLRSRISTYRIKHDRSYTAVGDLRHGYVPVTDVVQSPGAIHPLIRPHSATGRPSLYLGRRLNAYIVDLPVDESEALLDELWRYTVDPGLTWCHQWQVGDVLMWDNRCLMHRRDAFDPNSRRIMWRTQIQASDHQIA